MSAKQKRILVTAANGVGSHIVQAFQKEGYEVFGIARNEARKQDALAKNPGLPEDHVLVCDLASDEALSSQYWKNLITNYKIDGVVNSVMVTPKNSETKPDDKDQDRTYRVNTTMAVALFNACADKKIPVIQQSTLDAHIPNNKSDTYRKSKDQARIALQQIVHDKELNGAVLEAGMMTVPGSGHYRMEVIASMPVKLKPFQHAGILQPLALGDFTQAMVGMMQNLNNNRRDLVTPGTVYKAGGPTPMRYGKYIDGIRKAMEIDDRHQIPALMPLGLMKGVMNINSKLPLQPLGNFDAVDMAELQRNMSVSPANLDAYMKAGNLTTLRDPFIDYRAYAREQRPYTALGAVFANAGFDVERWLKSLWREKWDSEAPPLAGAPTVREMTAAKSNPGRKRVLVVGGTGFLGPLMVQELLASGHQVVCAVRSVEKAKKEVGYPGVEFMKVDLNTDLDSAVWKKRLQDYRIDAIVNNAGIEADSDSPILRNTNVKAPIAIIEACSELKKESAKSIRLIQISTGFLTSKKAAAFPYPKSKKAVEDALSKKRDVDWVVVRPNYVYEPGRGHILFEELVKLPMLAFSKDEAKQPVFNRDVAIGVARLVEPDSEASHCILEAAGPETLNWRGMLERVNEAMGEHLQYAPKVPYLAVSLMTKFNEKLPKPLSRLVAPLIKIDSDTLEKVNPKLFKLLCVGTNSNADSWIRYTGCKPASLAEVYRSWKAGPEAYADFCSQQRAQGKVQSTTPRANPKKSLG